MSCLRGLTAMLLALASAPIARAQTPTPPAPASIPGIKVVSPPPVGFDPVAASPSARAQFAIPPAPGETAAPRAYNEWKKAVAGIQNRVAAPVLTPTNIANGAIRDKKPNAFVPAGASDGSNSGNVSNDVVGATSSNWSGPSFVKKGGAFATEAIIGEFVVPTAHQAFGKCTGGWDYSSQWPGIDGNGSGDVLQAGVEVDAYCNGATTSSFYSAWIEWYPFNSTRVSSPAVNPGDVVFVEVWNTSPTSGFAYFYNYSTQIAAEYQLTAPSGVQLVGNSIEWIVERPSVGGSVATLTNYIDVSWPYNVAWSYAAATPIYHYPNVAPTAGGTLELIEMVGSGGAGLSYGYPQNSDFLYFMDLGHANGGNVEPLL